MDDADITIIHHATKSASGGAIPVRVDRWTLAKTRWRGTADDGRAFGFDLHHPLTHGDVIAEGYVIEQQAEDVLVVPLCDVRTSAELAWSIGNLHQPVQVNGTELIAADDSAVRNYFGQRQVAFRQERRVFQPLRAVHGHHHHG